MPRGDRRDARVEVRDLCLVVAAGVAALSLAWVGYVGSDDHSYARGALGWLHAFPYVGDDHWTLRHPVVLPIALSFAVLGFREISLAVPSALLFLLLLATTYHHVSRHSGRPSALAAAVLLATVPVLAVQATFPQNVIVETLAVSLSFWLFWRAIRQERPGRLLFAAGAAAAVGWLTRETTAGLLLFYALLFVVGYGVRRRDYWLMALGFVVVVGAEVAYFGALTGDPLYRYRIDLFHDKVDRVTVAGAITDASRTGLNLEGNLSVSAVLEPVVALLLNQEFGLLFWFFVPAAAWACFGRGLPPEERRLVRLLTALALVWMVFISVNASVLYVVPRYYAVSAWAAAIIVVLWLARGVFPGRPTLALVAGACLLITNLLGIYVENKEPLFAERRLVEYVVTRGGTVYTDPMTLTRARLLLEFHDASDRVRSGPVPPSALYYANMNNIERCRRSGPRCPWAWRDYLPRAGWTVVARIESPRKLSGIVAAMVGLDRIIPADILRRLDRPNSGGVVYAVSSAS
jgi:4-amino-4-deoxy-L-arabinose transferase-like glycosyltransferase